MPCSSGAIASTESDRHGALELFERAARLNPRDLLTLQALRLAREGKGVSVEELNCSSCSKLGNSREIAVFRGPSDVFSYST